MRSVAVSPNKLDLLLFDEQGLVSTFDLQTKNLQTAGQNLSELFPDGPTRVSAPGR